MPPKKKAENEGVTHKQEAWAAFAQNGKYAKGCSFLIICAFLLNIPEVHGFEIDSTSIEVPSGSWNDLLVANDVHGYHFFANAAGRDSYRVQARYLDSSAGYYRTSTLCTVTVSRGLLWDTYSCVGSCVKSDDDECRGTWVPETATQASLRIRCDSSDECKFSKVQVNMWEGGSCPGYGDCNSFCTDQGYTSHSYLSSVCKCARSDGDNGFVKPICTDPTPVSSPLPSPPATTPDLPACPSSDSSCKAACDGIGYTNGYSWSTSYSSGTGTSGTCTCFDSGLNQRLFDDCVSASPPPSPPPTPPQPTEQAEPTDTSLNCKCSCCLGNYCSASAVASFDAESSSDCGAADCRSRFPTLCPASGESGSVSASYSESTTSSSSPTTLTASPPSSDAQKGKVMHSLAAVVISLMLAL